MIDRAKSGDQKATEELIKRWTPSVQRFAYRLCPTTEVLDAVQESLLIFTTKIGQLRSANALVSWLFKIVKRQCQRAFSGIRNDIAISKALHLATEENRYFGPHELLLISEISTVLANLDEADRLLIIQKDIENRSLEAMASAHSLSLPALKSRLSRARTKLRTAINNRL